MPYLHIGQSVTVEEKRVIGIFDLDNTTWSKKSREFLDGAEAEGQVISVCEDIPRSFLLCDHPYHKQIIYLSQHRHAAKARRKLERGVGIKQDFPKRFVGAGVGALKKHAGGMFLAPISAAMPL